MTKRVETESERTLGPCPFCQACDAVLVTVEIDGMPEADEDYFVRCRNCFAQGPNRLEEWKAVRDWNAALPGKQSNQGTHRRWRMRLI